jgi:hypothetical protein
MQRNGFVEMILDVFHGNLNALFSPCQRIRTRLTAKAGDVSLQLRLLGSLEYQNVSAVRAARGT